MTEEQTLIELGFIREHTLHLDSLRPLVSLVIVEVTVPDEHLAAAAESLRETGWHISKGYEGEYLAARPDKGWDGVSIYLKPRSPHPGRSLRPPHPAVDAYLEQVKA